VTLRSLKIKFKLVLNQNYSKNWFKGIIILNDV